MIGIGLALLLASLPGRPLLERPDPEVEAGIAALEAGDAEGALSHFEAAARRHPARGGVHFNRGLALQALGRLDEAQEAFAQALHAGGAGREALHGLGHLHASRGELDQAIASFKSALARDPDDALARRNLEALLRQRQQEEQEQEQEQGPGESDEQEESESPEGEGDEEGEDDEEAEGDEGGEDEEASPGAGERGEDSEAPAEPEDPEEGAPEEEAGESRGGAAEEGPEPGEAAGAGAGDAPEAGEDGVEVGAAEGGVDEAPPSETERILDALKAREKSLQLFRRQDGKGRQRDVEKDW